jgi:hypothetical protein
MNGKQFPSWDGDIISCFYSVSILLFYLILFMRKSGFNVPYLMEYKNVCMLWVNISGQLLVTEDTVFPHQRNIWSLQSLPMGR